MSRAPGATLAQIAEIAGVSPTTISKVLNGRTDVAPATRRRIESLLLEHQYQRRGRQDSRAPLIELVFHELHSGWSMEIIRGVQEAAKASGLGLVLTESGTRQTPDENWLEGLIERRPRCVVLVFSDISDTQRAMLDARSTPFVIIDPAGDPASGVPAVGSANWSGGLSAVRHLIDLGHEHIGVISGPREMMCSHARVDGYRSAMAAARLKVDERWVRYGDFHSEGGAARARELLDLPEPPTAIFAGSDLQALGVYEVARERGMRIPDDLSVVGYDDIPLSQWISPQLTTVHQPLAAMGREAALMAVQLSSGVTPANTRMDLATTLVIRDSTSRPPHADEVVAGDPPAG